MSTTKQFDTAVYVGLSLSVSEARRQLPKARCEGPLKRGQLLQDLSDGVRTFLIVDGEFDQSLAVAPGEIIEIMSRGALVMGSSSMGALRAAELKTVGMIGVGRVYEYICRQPTFRDDWLGQVFDPEYGISLTLPFIEVATTAESWGLSIPARALGRLPHYSELTQEAYQEWIARYLGKLGLAAKMRRHIDQIFLGKRASQKELDACELIGQAKQYLARVEKFNLSLRG